VGFLVTCPHKVTMLSSKKMSSLGILAGVYQSSSQQGSKQIVSR